MRTGRLKLQGRPSLLLRFITDSGHFCGEASPLEGYGEDSYEMAERELRRLCVGELSEVVSTIVDTWERCGPLLGRLDGAANDSCNRLYLKTESPLFVVSRYSAQLQSPSARFCVETLALNAAARRCRVPLYRLLVDRPVAERLSTSSVIDPHRLDAVENALKLVALGINTFKVKCGRDERRESEVIQELCARCGPQLRLRLDANHTWSAEQTVRMVSTCQGSTLEWVEDPVPDLSQWQGLRERTSGVALAIDEALVGRSPSRKYLEYCGAEVTVLKPMALGGFSAAILWAEVARSLGFRVCVSHFFDGPVALDATIQLAFCVQSPDIAPGIGRHAALQAYSDLNLPDARWLKGNSLSLPHE